MMVPVNRRHATIFLALAVALVTFAVYLPALRNDFVWDDESVIVNNSHIREMDLDYWGWAVSSMRRGVWMPLARISYAIDYALWGLNPAGFHLTNILFHAAVAFLVVLLAVKLTETARTIRDAPSSCDGTGGWTGWGPDYALITGGVTGLLFGIHPLHVESAAWLSARNDLISAFFFLLSIRSYIEYVTVNAGGGAQDRALLCSWQRLLNRWYLLSIASFFLAVAGKPTVVAMPVVLLILDWHPLERVRTRTEFGEALQDKIPFAVLSAVIMILTLQANKAILTAFSTATTPIGVRLLVGAKALITYLWKMALPFDLSPFYQYPGSVSLKSWEYLSFVMVVCGIAALCVFTAKRQRTGSAVWLYYVIVLLPVLGIVRVRDAFMADRYTYLSSIGPFLLAGSGAAVIWRKTYALKKGAMAAMLTVFFLAVSICFSFSYLTVRQIGVWKDSLQLWNHVISLEPDRVPIAYYNRGLAYVRRGEASRAIEDFTKAIALRPQYYLAYNNRGIVLAMTGHLGMAIDDFTAAIRLNHSYADAYNNRGNALREQGYIDDALEDLNRAITLDPSREMAYMNRGITYGEAGLNDSAIDDFEMAIALNPSLGDAYTARGLMYVNGGQLDLAFKDFNKAIRIDPASGDAYLNRGVAFERMNYHELAVEDYSRAIELKPDDYMAYMNRGMAFGNMGRQEEALRDYRRACGGGIATACRCAEGLEGSLHE